MYSRVRAYNHSNNLTPNLIPGHFQVILRRRLLFSNCNFNKSSRSLCLGASTLGKLRREFRGSVLVLAGCLRARVLCLDLEVVVCGDLWWWRVCGCGCVCGQLAGQRCGGVGAGEIGKIMQIVHVLQ